MSERFALTDADAAGLDALAASQLRLALRFAERAEAEADVEAACKLARSSERAARRYTQALLLKSRLARSPAAEAPPPPRRVSKLDPETHRLVMLTGALQRLVEDERPRLDEDRATAWINTGDAVVEALMDEPDFAEADVVSQVAAICAALHRPVPDWAAELAEEAAEAAREFADSS